MALLPTLAALTLLSALALLPLLAVAVRLLALPPALLTLTIGAVAQLLLFAGHLVELVHRLAHALLALSLLALAALGLQVLHHLVELAQQFLRLGMTALARQLLDLLQHLLEIAAAHHALVRIVSVLREAVLALRPLGELAHVAVHGAAQILGQLLDLVAVGVALQSLLQTLLRGAERAFGVGKPAILDLQRHGPEPFRHLDELRIGLRRAQPLRAEPQAHVGAMLAGVEALGIGEQRIERDLHALPAVRIEH